MSAWFGYGGAVALVAVVITMVMLGRRRRPARSGVSTVTSTPTDDTAATGYVPGVWMLGGADSAAPSHHAHGAHHDAGNSHAGDAGGGTGDSGGGGGD
jgi:hypothetical protein